MRSFRYLYLATVREFVRDKSALFWTAAFPVMFMVIFGLAFSNEDDISFDLGVVNEDGAASQQLVDSFESIQAFDVHTGAREDELKALKDGDRAAVIVIPAGTGAALAQSAARLTDPGAGANPAPAALQVYYDPADTSTSQVVLNIVDKVVAGMNASLTGITPVLTVQSQEVSSTNLRYIDYLLPGVLAMSLMQLGLFGTAEPLVSLREKQVLRRMGATPLNKTTLLASQVVFRLTTALAQTGLIVAVGYVLFDVQIKMGNLPVILGVMLLGATVFITMGYFISGLAKTENAVQGIISLPNFVFMFMSGIFFPVDFMPDWLRPVVDVIPLTYLADGLRKTMIDAGSYFSLARSVGILAIWLVVCAALAVRLFRWEPQA